MSKSAQDADKILYLSTYPPRECGIATFTEDLVSAIDRQFNPKVSSRILSLNENFTSFYHYPPKVWGSIPANRIERYVAAAEEINARSDIKLVNIQHEFGIFGGDYGNYLIPFLQVIKKPVVTTFHSVLPKPDDFLRDLVRTICARSATSVVMNALSRDILVETYGIPRSRIVLIPHGIPSVVFEPSTVAQEKLGLSGKIVLSTFGLLSPSKGVEYAIRALPPLVERYPHLLYLVIGATHPIVQREDGETYRNFLESEVERLGLHEHVRFYNKYLALDEITGHLRATDVYVATALGKDQSVSGTISYALGCGRPVVSTKTAYASYLISEDCGTLVGFRKPAEITRAIDRILSNDKLRKDMGATAYAMTRKMAWPNVARSYFSLFKRLAPIGPEERKLPPIKFDHVIRFTDNFGMMHHARYARPEKRFGYSLDDNARAIIVAASYYAKTGKPELLPLLETYLSFLEYNQRRNGLFARLALPDHTLDLRHDDDVLGRALWALGLILTTDTVPEKIRLRAQKMFEKSIEQAKRLAFPRAIAFAVTGLYHYARRFSDPRTTALLTNLADRELALYKESATDDWPWFEDRFTYSNSKLSEALYYAYDLTHDKKYLVAAEKSLKFLCSITFEKNHYSPIGQAGWYIRTKKRAYFDQQPEDTASMVETKVAAYRITGKREHADDAYDAFQWFLGRNHLGVMVYDDVTGGCHDGLGQHAPNLNQGAESTLSYLLARLAIEDVVNKG